MGEPVKRNESWWLEQDGKWLLWDQEAEVWNEGTGPPPPPREKTKLATSTSFALEHWSAILAVAGLVLYAVVRVAHDQFYARFAVTPEEVGLNQTLILGRAALYFFFYGAVVGLLVVLGLGLSKIADAADKVWRARVARSRESISSMIAKILVGSLTSIMGLVTGSIAALGSLDYVAPARLFIPDEKLANPHWLLTKPLMVATVSLTGIVVLAALTHGAIWANRNRPRGLGSVRLSITLTIAATVTIITSLIVSGRYGYVTGEIAARGRAIRTTAFGLLSVEADPVCLDWLDADTPNSVSQGGIREPFMYLGQANGWVVLYDYHEFNAPLRVPAGKAVLEIAHPPPNDDANTLKCPPSDDADAVDPATPADQG